MGRLTSQNPVFSVELGIRICWNALPLICTEKIFLRKELTLELFHLILIQKTYSENGTLLRLVKEKSTASASSVVTG